MRRVCLALLCSVILSAPAAAQSNVEVNAGVQFDFLSPGARSLAMGSAFIGMADDATAAFVNPAGLRAISRREISFEGRGRDFSIPVITGGRINGTVSNTGVDRSLGIVEEDISQSAGGLSFLSFVYPQSRWAIAGYRHELANFDTRVQTGGVFFEDFDENGVLDDFRRLPIIGTMDLSIVSYGVSGSFNITPQFSIGAGLSIYDFGMESRTDRFAISTLNPPGTGAADYSEDNIQNYQLQEGDSTQVGVNIGALFAPSRMFQVGAVYRQGPDFDIRVASLNPTNDEPFPGRDRETQFHVPHVFGVGVLYRPMANGTIAVDITNVGYSRMTDGFVDIFVDEGSPDDESALYSIDSATEFHAGFEYVFTNEIPFAVRGGYWFDPEHALVYNGLQVGEAEVFRDRDENQHHFTAGAGAVFGRFEINGAGDFASRATTISFSAVVRF